MEKLDLTYDFKKAFEKFSELLRCGFSIKQISDLYDVSPYQVIDILLSYENSNYIILNAIKRYYLDLKITDNKVLLVADSHIGRTCNIDKGKNYAYPLYNEKVLFNAYNFALKNDIKNVIHAGDILEGNSMGCATRLQDKYQIEYLKNIYKDLNSIKTYLLLGNHDYNLIYYDGIDLGKEIREIPNIEIIGINYSYMLLNNALIKIEHFCKASDFIKNITLPVNLTLYGHSHVYSFNEKERNIYLPPLSCIGEPLSSAGFIELINEDDRYIFHRYDGNASFKEERVLKK